MTCRRYRAGAGESSTGTRGPTSLRINKIRAGHLRAQVRNYPTFWVCM